MERYPGIDARKLLSENRKIRARASVVHTQIERARMELQISDDEIISSIALRPREMAAQRGAISRRSAVEYVAEYHRLRKEEEMEEAMLWIQAAKVKLNALNATIRLYDAVMELMRDVEKKFIALHYDDKVPMSRIIEEHAKEVGNPHSVNTLKRMNSSILQKIEEVINL